MRILLSAYACDPDAGTEPGNGWNWAWHLASVGHDVWVLTGTNAGDRLRERSRGQPNLHFVEVAPSTIGDRVLRGAPAGHLRYVTWLGRSFLVARRLARSIRFDLVHHVTFASLVWGTPLRRLSPPLVFGPVGGGQVTPRSLAPYLTRFAWLEAFRRAVLRPAMLLNPLAVRTLRDAAAVFVTNRDTERLARACGASRVFLACDTSVPPEMNDAATLSDHREDGPVRLLWLGRLLPRKGLPLALDALSRVDTPTPWECVIVGGGPLGDDVPGWIERAGLRDRVRWVGSVPWNEVARHYREADVFLFTSLRDASGAQLFEAAAFGLPMIGLAHQGMADLIPEDVAIKVPILDGPGTADALARAVESLIDDRGRRARMREAAVRFARANSWPERVREVYSIVEPIVDARPSGR
jgi:glycosyltransferase involved in cell wall biosynthesis